MPARPQPPSEDRPVNNLRWVNDEAIQTYLAVTDDGETARLAATTTPKGEVFDARAQVAQATELQAEVTALLVRRREVIANSMSYATLLELARLLGIGDVGFLHMIDEESLPDDPISGPVWRRLAKLMRAMPPPQDFQDQFLAEDPTAALELAASRTALSRPLPNATFEEALRYAANIPADEVSWAILIDAFFDFLRLWGLGPPLPVVLFPADAGAVLTQAELTELLANLKRHQQDLACFHDTFTPGQQFPPDIDELAHRAYAECWEHGLLGPFWRRRLAWLVVEFTPFWHRHGEAYRALEADDKAKRQRAQIKKSAQTSRAGRIGAQSREAKNFRTLTTDFIDYLKENSGGSSPAELKDCVDTFVESRPSLKGNKKKNDPVEFLQSLCTAVTKGMEARTVLDTLQRSLLTKNEALIPALREQRFNELLPNQRKQYSEKGTIPPDWVQFKALTEESVGDCLVELKHAVSKACVKKSQK